MTATVDAFKRKRVMKGWDVKVILVRYPNVQSRASGISGLHSQTS
jgi:hypothetical protein